MKRCLSIGDMLDIQDRLNEITTPEWRTNRTISECQVAILDEISEFLGSVPWKWWKATGEIDRWNMKIEAVDILHFCLSTVMLTTRYETNRELYFGLPDNTARQQDVLITDGQLDHEHFINVIHDLIVFSDDVYYVNEFLKAVNLTSEELSAIYMAKATLNEIRQNGGYKDGTYIKNYEGIEDNYRLRDIVEYFMEHNDVSLDEVRKMTFGAFTHASS